MEVKIPAQDRLPEEILLQILTYLDESSPSVSKARLEPDLQLTASQWTPLKNCSLASKQWRRLVLPLLFRSARIHLHGSDIAAFNRTVSSEGDRAAANGQMTGDKLPKPKNPIEGRPLHQGSASSMNDTDHRDGSNGALRLLHPLIGFLDFIQDQHLASVIDDFVLLTSTLQPETLDRFPHTAADRDWRYRASAFFWNRLLSFIDPRRVVIVAPPTDLAALTNCAIDTFGEWAFSDMDYHIIELRQDRSDSRCSGVHDAVGLDNLDHTPRRYPGLARSSVLNLRPWTHVSVNEGSFLKAYGTYEFFERGPPSLVYSIKDCLTPRPIFSPHNRISDTPLASLRSFTYTAIFPFSNHLEFHDLLPQLEELDLKLAPDPQSDILDSPQRRGKAELDDCWSELFAVYTGVAAALATYKMSEAEFPRLKRFICRDMHIPALQDELNDTFIHLCLPVWAEYDPGVFLRIAGSADVLGIGTHW